MSYFRTRDFRHSMAVIAVTVVVLAAIAISSPSNASSNNTDSVSNSTETVVASTSEEDPYRSTAAQTVGEYHPPILIVTEEVAQQVAKQPAAVYSASILKALKSMRLTTQHLSVWAQKHENSTLSKISDLPENEQRRIACIACYIRRCNRRLSPENIWREGSDIYFYGRKYDVAPELVAAVAKAESTYVPNCVSRRGACGVMQVMYHVHKARLAKHGIATQREHMFDPERGVHAGVLILKGYVSAMGSVKKGLMRYLGGHSDRYYARVQNCVTKIRQTGESLGL